MKIPLLKFQLKTLNCIFLWLLSFRVLTKAFQGPMSDASVHENTDEEEEELVVKVYFPF